MANVCWVAGVPEVADLDIVRFGEEKVARHDVEVRLSCDAMKVLKPDH